jgi:hypothetical protein
MANEWVRRHGPLARSVQLRASRSRARQVRQARYAFGFLGETVRAIVPDGAGGIVVYLPPHLVEVFALEADRYRMVANTVCVPPVSAVTFRGAA